MHNMMVTLAQIGTQENTTPNNTPIAGPSLPEIAETATDATAANWLTVLLALAAALGLAVIVLRRPAARAWMGERLRDWIGRVFTEDDHAAGSPAGPPVHAGGSAPQSAAAANGTKATESKSEEENDDETRLKGLMRLRQGHSYAMTAREYDHSREGLAWHIDRFLRQDRSEEALRQFAEDFDFLAVDSSGLAVPVHMRVFTQEQLNKLPVDLRVALASERMRRHAAPPAASAGTNGHAVTVHEKRGPGRPRTLSRAAPPGEEAGEDA